MMPRMIYVNLPVTDLAAATLFYEAIGCEKNARFSDKKASSMVWSDTITFQLLTRKYFASFAHKPVADAHQACGVLLAITRDSREEVDAIVEAAAAAGGKADVRERMDMGWLYNRAFEDPDGHVFEAVWMDMKAMVEADEART
jgi:predicted lactoylglutathione lyase